MEKVKKVVMYALLVSSSSWGLLVPTAASAGFFSISSILSSLAPQASASSEAPNSQTMGLLAPATNLDPNPSVGGGDITIVDNSAIVAQDGPSGTAADLGDKVASSNISVYVVRDGDTLSGIAQMYDVPVGTITGANNLQGKSIAPGQELIILPIAGIQYTVKAGDTIAGIAKAHNSDAFDIRQYNDLGSDADLIAGASILIPNAEAPSSAVASSAGSSVTKPKATTKKIVTTRTPAVHHVSSDEPYLGGGGPAIPGYFAWPLAGGVITQGLHGYNAVDIGAPRGTPIYAAAGGTVIIAIGNGGYNGGYGNYVVVRHPNGTQTLYAHMSRVLTSVGAGVAKGEQIGAVGTTGYSTGNHLHFEVRGAANPFAN